MILEDQVVNLELSQKLKAFGIEQTSLYYWYSHTDSLWMLDPAMEGTWGNDRVSAFTMAEMIELLPIHVMSKDAPPLNSYRLFITKSFVVNDPVDLHLSNITIVNYKPDTFDVNNLRYDALTKNIWDKNSANALAKMLIFLIENDLMGIPNEN